MRIAGARDTEEDALVAFFIGPPDDGKKLLAIK